MTDDLKTYKPETIVDQPLPGQDSGVVGTTGSVGTNDIFRPETIPDQAIPTTVIASEVVSNQINTTGGKGTVIDALGLVSSENFNYGSVYIDTQPVYTPGDNNYHDIPDTEQTFELKRITRVLFLISVAGLPNSSGDVNVRMNITGIDLNHAPFVLIDGSYGEWSMWTTHRVYEVDAGSITFKLQYRVNSPSTSIQLNIITSTFLVLGT